MKKTAFLLALLVLSSCANMKKNVRANHSNLPTPIDPYSHSVISGDLIFVSGQIGIDPKSNLLKEDIQAQTVQIFENLKGILKDKHSDLNHITKTTVFITDMKQFQEVNEIYGSYFKEGFPARSTIQVVALPKNAKVEIECIAIKK